jgi:hypothetical protein
MASLDPSEWLKFSIVLLSWAIFAGIAILAVRAYFRSRHDRRRFLAALSRLKAMDWLSAIGIERQKKLTYQPEHTQQEDRPDS